MSKGDWRRKSQVPDEELQKTWDAVFGPKKLNIMSEEERLELEREKARLSEDVGQRMARQDALEDNA